MRKVRWTEHGPEPYEDDGGDGEGTEDAPLTEAPVMEASADADPGAAPAPADDASPVTAPAPPAPLAPPAPEPQPALPVDDVEAVRQRLAERGLLRQEPSVRIRDVTDAPASRPPEVTFVPEPTSRAEVADDPADAAGLDAERVGPGSEVLCPKCRTAQDVADDASGFVCASCSTVWRWAICTNCADVSLTFARQESWRCAACGSSSRSWWRTATAARDGQLVRTRRRDDLAAARRARAYEIARKRRWKVIAAGVAVIAAAGVAAFVATQRSTSDATRGAGARTCDTFFEASLSPGTDPAEVRASLDELAAVADEAPDEVRIPAQRLAASGGPGDPAFETARTALATACR